MSAASRATIPNSVTTGEVMVPTSNSVAPTAAISGQIDPVGAAVVAATPSSSFAPSRVESIKAVSNPVAATRPNSAVAPIADSPIRNI